MAGKPTETDEYWKWLKTVGMRHKMPNDSPYVISDKPLSGIIKKGTVVTIGPTYTLVNPTREDLKELAREINEIHRPNP